MMKYSRKVAPIILVAAAVLNGPIIVYALTNRTSDKPQTQAVNPATTTPVRAPAFTQNFTEIEGLNVGYPAQWAAKPASGNAAGAEQLSVAFEAPGTATREDSHGSEQTVSGAKIHLYRNNFSQWRSIEDFKKSDNFIWQHAENKRDYTVKDMQVLEFDVAHEGPTEHYAFFYKNGVEYALVMSAEAYKKPEHKATFDQMIQSMEFARQP